MLQLQDILHRALAAIITFLPIPLRIKLWQYALRQGTRRWPRESTAQRIPAGMYAKIGPERVIRLSEGQALRHIHAHTSGIPVPRVIDNFTHKGVTYLIMTRLPGYPLNDSDRYFEIDSRVEQLLSAQLTSLLAPLRALPPPSDAICGFDGGPIYDVRVRYPDGKPAGPWSSVSEFHEDLLRRTCGLKFPEHVDSEAALDVIKRAHARQHRVCLTHNDLGPHNLLVDDDWNITGIVDWEAAAWMPEYW